MYKEFFEVPYFPDGGSPIDHTDDISCVVFVPEVIKNFNRKLNMNIL